MFGDVDELDEHADGGGVALMGNIEHDNLLFKSLFELFSSITFVLLTFEDVVLFELLVELGLFVEADFIIFKFCSHAKDVKLSSNKLVLFNESWSLLILFLEWLCWFELR